MGDMISLEQLHLCDNLIELVPESLCRLQTLRGLYLKNNLMTCGFPAALTERLENTNEDIEFEGRNEVVSCEDNPIHNHISIVCLSASCITEDERDRMCEESAVI